MKEIKLATQLNLIFSIVTLLTSLIFIVALNRVFSEFRVSQNELQLSAYLNDVRANITNPPASEYNGYVVVQAQDVVSSHNLDVLDGHYSAVEIADMMLVWPGQTRHVEIDGDDYYFRIDRRIGGASVIVFTSEDYLSVFGNAFSTLMRISFIALVLLGNVIILLWSRITVERIKRLQGEVQLLRRNNYQEPIEIDGNDEITELAKTIEKMRQEIQYAEKSKQEMLQNISHDFKTPIAVIQSYAEAIGDGVSDINEAEVIVKQAEMLNQKVKQLLELNKLEYLKDASEFEDIRIKDILINIVNNQKYRTHIEIETELDDSTYFGVKENFYTAFTNIIDNALRYAKSKIIITLKNKKLTFYNDGEPINDKFIDHVFRPYEKGQNGQFGLGMSIVQKTCAHFNLVLKVENASDGVLFTIEPL
ncbi:MAG: HAMP domain-containing sensor histidine kinase [Acholeplasmataceae bacterium]|jgi:two-component system sensor histidine kinase CssS|nr:HAMP domain-containing sensor histidine kinase [Acholeplasmataceae bacterium]